MKLYYLRMLLFSLAWGGSQVAWSQATLTASEAYNYLQNQRHQAETVLGDAEQPPADSLKKSERILRDALAYYHRPDVQALAKDDKYLFARKGDILFDLSVIQLKSDQKIAAVQSLQTILKGNGAPFYADFINNEPIFAPVRQNPAIAPILTKISALNKVFSSNALQTPYQPNISDEEKIAGLSKLWSEAKYNFAYFDRIPDVNWDQLYLDYIPKVRATTSTLNYLRVMQEFCAHLRDGHTNVWAKSDTLAGLVNDRPPIRTVLVENKVFIQEVYSDSLAKTGIRPGLEVLRIDEVPVQDYAARHVRPYQSGSTPQNIDVATYTYNLLKGAKDKPVTIDFRDAKGKTFRRILPRSGYTNVHSSPTFSFSILPGKIAYVQLNSFENNRASKAFAAAFDSIAATNALILDVRQNGGGNSDIGWNILGYLTDSSFQTGSYSSRLYSPLRRAQGEGVMYESVGKGSWSANGKKVFTKPVVVLTSGRTFSAAEDFVVAFDAMQRGKLIGEATGGSTGQPLVFSLPGGLMARVCTKRDTYPDGREWVGIGIQPDIPIKPTIADLLARRDTVLDAALQYLRNPVRKNSKR